MPRLLPRVTSPEAGAAPSGRPPRVRYVHPWAWWGWAICASTAVSLTLNPLVVALIATAMVIVVLARRPDTPWAKSLRVYLILGAFIVGMRLVFQILLGGMRTGTVLFVLPSLTLPSWAAGITLGGAVTAEALAFALFDALRLAVMLLCVGAANSLANPRTALKSVPGALRDISTAVVIALSLIPQLISSIHRVRRGQRLRGGRRRGASALPGTVIPVIEDAVEGSMQLATSMEARGFGRSRTPEARTRGTWPLLAALLMIVLGIYVLLGVPRTADGLLGLSTPAWLAFALIGAGIALTVWGMRAAGQQLGVTRYRPAPWGRPEAITLASGVGGLAVIALLLAVTPSVMNPQVSPFTWPTLPPLAILSAACFAIPGFATPAPRTPA